MFFKTSQRMLREDLIHQTMKFVDLYQQVKIKIKKTGLMKDELGGKLMTKFVGFRRKTCSYLISMQVLKRKRNNSEKQPCFGNQFLQLESRKKRA